MTDRRSYTCSYFFRIWWIREKRKELEGVGWRRKEWGKARKGWGEKSRAVVHEARGHDSKEILSLSPSFPPFSTCYARRKSTRLIYYSRLVRLFRAGPSFSPFRFVLLVLVFLSLRSLSSENSLYLANEFKDIGERARARVFLDVNGRRNRFSSTFPLLLEAIAWPKCASWTHWEDRSSKSTLPFVSTGHSASCVSIACAAILHRR